MGKLSCSPPLANLALQTLMSVYRPLFWLLESPKVKIKKPAFVAWPSSMFLFTVAMVSYFLITGGMFQSFRNRIMAVFPCIFWHSVLVGFHRVMSLCNTLFSSLGILF